MSIKRGRKGSCDTRGTAARLLIATGVAAALAAPAYASSHREALEITRTPKIDGTDLYMFRSYEEGRQNFVTIIADYQPLEDPFGGPNYYMFDEKAIYEIHIDNTGNGRDDITFQFRFDNERKNFALPVGGVLVPIPLIDKGQIGPGDTTNLNVIESYSLSVVRGQGRAERATDAATGADRFIKPVDNIGEKTIPQYAAYANQFIYNIRIPGCGTPGRVFVGQRKEPFVIAVGETFDLINFKNPVGEQFANSERDDLASKNISSLILEVPINCLTAGEPVIGAWTTASTRRGDDDESGNNRDRGDNRDFHAFAQKSRLGNPLVNELVIGLRDKDRFNASEPRNDAQFLTYVTNPTFPALVQLIFGTPAPTVFPRADLVATFLTGIAGVNQPAHVRPAELMRLNTTTPATPAAMQNRLGVIGGDPAGYPNGRRPGDDVVDITIRVAMGKLIGNPSQAPSGNLEFTDGALVDAGFFDGSFPYLKPPLPGSPGQSQPSVPLPPNPILPGFEPVAGP